MIADTLTPTQLFGLDIRYTVPIFQRPYVWTEDEQWAPLWSDVQRVAERLVGASPRALRLEPAHFLGAIVLEVVPTTAGRFAEHSIVDGQQRLMTLQLLVDAAEEVVRERGDAADADDLRRLVHNAATGDGLDSPRRFKVWPGLRDRESFRAAMSRGIDAAEVVRDRVQQARAFFTEQIRAWAGAAGGDDATARLHALALALREYLKLVVINLEAGDNAQVVFESLNHRGAPLLAADLIKNYVFQLAQEEVPDVVGLYERSWRQLDTRYWREHEEITDDSGPRIDEFLRQWLLARLLRAVPNDQLYPAFREYVTATGVDQIEAILSDLAAEANAYGQLATLPVGSAPERFRYRVLDTLGLTGLAPLLLRLLIWDGLPDAARDRALAAVESWAVRRALCRIRNTDTTQVVVSLLRAWRGADPASVGALTESVLASGTGETRVWPSDDELRKALVNQPIYELVVSKRLRIVLEAIEERLRSVRSEDSLCPRTLSVEHIMPTRWRAHWSEPGAGPAGQTRRDRRIHELGNLTLVTGRFNAALANLPWTDEEAIERRIGRYGKRSLLVNHSVLLLNTEIVAKHPTAWTDRDISARTDRLVQLIQRVWPVSLSASQEEIEPPPDGDGPTSARAKFEPLTSYLLEQTAPTVELRFGDVSDILGAPLPKNATERAAYWRNRQLPIVRALRAGGYRVAAVDVEAQVIVLTR
jgi:hypothetical protein